MEPTITLHVTARQLELLTAGLSESAHNADDPLDCTSEEFDELYDKLTAAAAEHSDYPREE